MGARRMPAPVPPGTLACKPDSGLQNQELQGDPWVPGLCRTPAALTSSTVVSPGSHPGHLMFPPLSAAADPWLPPAPRTMAAPGQQSAAAALSLRAPASTPGRGPPCAHPREHPASGAASRHPLHPFHPESGSRGAQTEPVAALAAQGGSGHGAVGADPLAKE